MKTKLTLVLLFATLTISSCHKNRSEPNSITEIGIVRDIPPGDNCGAFMITVKTETDPEKLYKPDNLSNKFKINNLKIEFTYQLTDKKHDCGFGGHVPIIKILKIKKL